MNQNSKLKIQNFCLLAILSGILFCYADSAYATNTSLFSVSVWVNPSTSVASKAIMGKAEELRVATNASGYPLCQIKSSSSWQTAVTSSAAVSTGQWAHVLCTYDLITFKIYINGKLSGTQALTAVADDTSAVWKLGKDDSASTPYGYFIGLMDNYKFYNYALTAEQVKEDYNGGKAFSVGNSVTANNNGTTVSGAAAQYCVPGDTAQCDAPVGEWKMDEKVSGDAQTIYDSSGNGNNGTTVDGANNTGMDCSKPGKYGTACEFDGADDYLETSVGTAPSASCDYSISFWMKSNGLAPTSDPVAWGYRSFMFYTGSGTRLLSFGQAGSWWAGAKSTTSLDDSQWHYVVGTVYGGGSCTDADVKIYVDGRLEGTATENVNNNNYYMAIGGAYLGRFPGIIDNVRRYDYVRTPAQIAWEYNKGKPVAQWKMDECSGTTIHDESGNNNHGTLSLGSSDQTSAGTCSANANTAWYNGRSGKFGASLNFDGEDDYVDTVNFSPFTQFSLSYWCKAVSSDSCMVSKYFNGTGNGDWLIGVNSGGKAYFASWTGGYSELQSNSSLVTGNWYHLVFVFDSDDNKKIYINGKFDNSENISGDIDTHTQRIVLGARAISSTPVYDPGQIDDVRLYNYALTPLQIKEVYNEGFGIKF